MPMPACHINDTYTATIYSTLHRNIGCSDGSVFRMPETQAETIDLVRAMESAVNLSREFQAVRSRYLALGLLFC